MKFYSAAVAALQLSMTAAFTTTKVAHHHHARNAFDTALKNGMDAYDAQMRAFTSGGASAAPPNPTNGAFPQPTTSANPLQPQAPAPRSTGYEASFYADTNSAFNTMDNFKLDQRWRKKTKQLATLGPASSSFEMIEKLFLAGADVFRLNFSHGEHAQKKELVDIIRQVEAKYEHPIAILGDLQGPKLRVGQFANPDGEVLQAGQAFRFDLDPSPGTNQRVQLPHPEIIEASQPGHVLLIDDGKMKMTVTGSGPGYIDCVVDVAGRIKDKKGVNTPDSVLEISPLTPKDRADLEFMLKECGVDWVALSFVQRPEDIVEIKGLILNHLPTATVRPSIMAKIEKPSCFEGDSLTKIVELCDGIMVARGDLGVECAPEDVPILQKEIVDTCREQGKPVVVATQMLESMIESPTPTRAEASDVATAIYDGADAIMLSAESAAGMYPVESVLMQQRIINRVEGDPHYHRYLQSFEPGHDSSAAAAIILAARLIARTVKANAIASYTVGGSTARRASKKRPDVPILAISPLIETCRQLALCWGVYPEYTTDIEDDFRIMLHGACEIARKKGLVSSPNDLLVVTAGFPFGTPGAANVVRVVPAAGPTHWDASL